MVPIGMAIIWAGYTLGIYGYCLVKDYDVQFPALFRTTWPGSQVNQTAPAGGRKLGVINNNTEVTDPGQLRSQQGQ